MLKYSSYSQRRTLVATTYRLAFRRLSRDLFRHFEAFEVLMKFSQQKRCAVRRYLLRQTYDTKILHCTRLGNLKTIFFSD